jgi:hypothetical protein
VPWLSTTRPAGDYKAMWAPHSTPLLGGGAVLGERTANDLVAVTRNAGGMPVLAGLRSSGHKVAGPIPTVPPDGPQEPLLAVTFNDNAEMRYFRDNNGAFELQASQEAFGAGDHREAVIQGPPTGAFTASAGSLLGRVVASHVVWGARNATLDTPVATANVAVHLAALCDPSKARVLVADANGVVTGLRVVPLPGNTQNTQAQTTGTIPIAGTAVFPPVVVDAPDPAPARVFVFRNTANGLEVHALQVDSNGALQAVPGQPLILATGETMSGPAAVAVVGNTAQLVVPTASGKLLVTTVIPLPSAVVQEVQLNAGVAITGVIAFRALPADTSPTLLATDATGVIHARRAGQLLPGFPVNVPPTHTITQAPLVMAYPGATPWHLVVASDVGTAEGFLTGWTFGEASDASNQWTEYQQGNRNRGCVVVLP